MTAPNSQDGVQSAVAPLSSSSSFYTLDVSTVDANIVLPNGIYLIWLKSQTAGVTVGLKIGGAASIPATGVGNVVAGGFAFPGTSSGERVIIRDADSSKALHAILSTSASADTLNIIKIS